MSEHKPEAHCTDITPEAGIEKAIGMFTTARLLNSTSVALRATEMFHVGTGMLVLAELREQGFSDDQIEDVIDYNPTVFDGMTPQADEQILAYTDRLDPRAQEFLNAHLSSELAE